MLWEDLGGGMGRWEAQQQQKNNGKESACNAGDMGSTPESGRFPGKEMATQTSNLVWEIS